MLAQSLVLLVMTTQAATTAATFALPRLDCSVLCNDLRTSSPLQCSTICNDLQELTTQCGFPDTADNLRAQAASTSPLSYAATILKDLSEAHTLGPGAGSYDLCQGIPTAEYCISQLQITLGEKTQTLTTMATCVNHLTCNSSTVSQAWTSALSLASIISGAGNSTQLPLSAVTTCGENSYDWEAGSYVWIVVCGALVLMTLVCTIHAVATASPEGVTVDLSLLSHWNAFVSARPPKLTTGCMDGIRWMSMCWVVMGHSLLWPLLLGVGYSNLDEILPSRNEADRQYHDPIAARWTGQAVQSAEFSVDSFFFMSGFLAIFIGLKKLRSATPLAILCKAPLMMLDRFLRLTPTYMVVLFAVTYVVPLVSEGPYWHLATQSGVDACKANWWHNLLYVQSILAAVGAGGTMCFNVAWYLADDMAFFCLVPFLLALAVWKRWAAHLIIFALASISIIAAGITSHQDEWSVGIFDQTSYGSKYYFPPWFRVPPYLLGAAFALIWTDYAKDVTERLRSSLVLQCATWGLVSLLMLSTFYGITPGTATSPGSTSRVNSDVYICLSKTAWTVGVMALCVLCFSGCGGVANWFLAHPAMGVMGKLTYCTYLLHTPIMQIVYGSRVSSVHFSTFEYSHTFVGFLGLSAAAALVLHLFVEIPTGKLIDILLPHRQKPKLKQVQEQPDNESDKKGSELSQTLIV